MAAIAIGFIPINQSTRLLDRAEEARRAKKIETAKQVQLEEGRGEVLKLIRRIHELPHEFIGADDYDKAIQSAESANNRQDLNMILEDLLLNIFRKLGVVQEFKDGQGHRQGYRSEVKRGVVILRYKSPWGNPARGLLDDFDYKFGFLHLRDMILGDIDFFTRKAIELTRQVKEQGLA